MAEKKEKTFEEKLSRLQEIVDKVEGETLPLEESMKLYEEGKALVADLNKTLSEAEKKIGKFQVSDKDTK
jgi:exodeoxyribonuclease VII small subunit